MKKFIEKLTEFFKKNWINISFVVVALFLILAIVAVRNIQFKRHPNKALEKIILYEKFRGREGFDKGGKAGKADRMPDAGPRGQGALVSPPKDGDVVSTSDPKFCSRSKSLIEEGCRGLAKADDCKQTECCIWALTGSTGAKGGCMAGHENGPLFDSERKNLEQWYYKGKKKYAKLYNRNPDAGDPGSYDNTPDTKPPRSESETDTEDEAMETLETAAAIGANQATSERLLKQEQARKKLKQEQDFINELAALRDKHKVKNIEAKTKEQTVNALAIVNKEAEIKKAEKDLDAAKLQAVVDEVEGKSTGGALSPSDELTVAKSQLAVEEKKRVLDNLAREGRSVYQGEKAAGVKIDTNDGRRLGREMTPDSVKSKASNTALLLAAQDLLKKGSDGVAKAAQGQVEAFIGRARSGLTNYFRQ